MRKMNFRDVMSQVPTSVSIISCVQKNIIFGCTISSLVSVNISEKSPEVIFVLKKDSQIGSLIRLVNFFSINVLSSNQEHWAKKYSEQRNSDTIKDEIWNIDSNFASLPGARVIICCKLKQIYDSHAANIFVGSVVQYSEGSKISALIYNQRGYEIL